MKELANLLFTAFKEINKAVKELRLKQQDLMDYCTRINNFEHEGDKVYRNAIAGAIMGVGATRRLSAVRWELGKR